LRCEANITQFLSSRPSTPIPFRPKRSNTLDIPSIESSPLRNGESAEPKAKTELQNNTQVDKLEAMVSGEQADVKSAGV